MFHVSLRVAKASIAVPSLKLSRCGTIFYFVTLGIELIFKSDIRENSLHEPVVKASQCCEFNLRLMHLWFIVLCWTDLPYFPLMSHSSWLILIIKWCIRSTIGGEIITKALWECGSHLNCSCSVPFRNYEMPLPCSLHNISSQRAAFEKSWNCKTGGRS